MITLSLWEHNLSYTKELFKGAAVYLTHRGNVGNQSAKVSRSKADCYSAEPPATPFLPLPPPLRNLGRTFKPEYGPEAWFSPLPGVSHLLAQSLTLGQSIQTQYDRCFTCANTPGPLRMCLVKK